jgi:hypothetical protein
MFSETSVVAYNTTRRDNPETEAKHFSETSTYAYNTTRYRNAEVGGSMLLQNKTLRRQCEGRLPFDVKLKERSR